MSKNDTAVMAWLGSFAANIGNLLIGVATGVLTARLLLPAGRGELAELVFWGATVSALGSLSVPSAVVVGLAQDEDRRSVAANAIALAALLAVAVASVFAILYAFVLKVQTGSAVLLYVCMLIPVAYVGVVLTAVDQGHQRFARYNFLRLLPQSTYLLLLLPLWASGTLRPVTCALAIWAGSLAVIVARAPFIVKETTWDLSWRKMGRLLRCGVAFHAGVLAILFLQYADQFVIVGWLRHYDLGIYAVAMTASGVALGVITTATNAIMLPKLAATADIVEQRRKLRIALGGTLLTATGTNFAMAIAAPMLVPLLFGSEYASAAPVTILLCAMQVPRAFVSVGVVALRAIGDWWSGVLAPGTGMLGYAVAVPLLLPGYGIAGVAAAMLAGWSLAMVAVLWRISAKVHLPVLTCLVPPASEIRSLVRTAIARAMPAEPA